MAYKLNAFTGKFDLVNNIASTTVFGPGSSTDNALVRWDGTTGTLIQNSVAILSDAGALSGLTSLSVTGPTTLNGAQIYKRTATAISYTVLITDMYVGVTSTAAPRTISLPNVGVTAGQVFTVKDESGGAATNNITVDVNGGVKTIDGAASQAINGNYDGYNFIYDGTNYFTW
jgi:hypothetical protein